MRRSEAEKKYGIRAVAEYSDAETVFYANSGDADIKTIKIKLPEPPDWKLIDGWGLPANKQKFTLQKYPEKLISLERQVKIALKQDFIRNPTKTLTPQKIISRMWEELSANTGKYYNEILWIQKQWWHRIYGYWFFCNGRPTYITGCHFKFLNYWSMGDVDIPEYRDVNRREFLFIKFAETFSQDLDGNDIGMRLCKGIVRPKVRRGGLTNIYLCALEDWATLNKGIECGIQSYDDDNAESHYKDKLLPAFDNYPFFFKPMWIGSSRPNNKLTFRTPPQIFAEQLDSTITYASNPNRKFYNGKKLFAMLIDEAGQTEREDIIGRHNAYIHCVSTGAGKMIHGMMFYPSTIIEANENTIQAFRQLCDNSKFEERDETTMQTLTGLFVYFVPAYEMEGFIGEFGESVTDDPTPEQMKFIHNKNGAKKYIDSQLQQFLQDKDFVSYYEFSLQHPRKYIDCFLAGQNNAGFNTLNITQAQIRVSRMNNAVVSGNFKWRISETGEEITSAEYISRGYVNDNFRKDIVVWCPDKADSITKGRWNLSLTLPEHNASKFIFNKGEREPINKGVFTASGDTYQFLDQNSIKKNAKSTDNKRLSNGGGAVFYERDFAVDPLDKDKMSWQSNRTVCDYDCRPDSVEEYCEDMLMMCIYFGAEMFPENNIKNLLEWFINRNCRGFLLYATDPVTGEFKKLPGYTTLAGSKQDLFNLSRSYIENYSHLERHMNVIMEWKEIKGLGDMTNHDLFTAWAGCLKGSKERKPFDTLKKKHTPDKLSSMSSFLGGSRYN